MNVSLLGYKIYMKETDILLSLVNICMRSYMFYRNIVFITRSNYDFMSTSWWQSCETKI